MKRETLERGLSIVLRSLHLVGVVLVGAAVVNDRLPGAAALWLMAGTGLALLLVECRAGRMALTELAGAVVLLKLLLIGLMALAPALAPGIFWGLLLMSSVSAHAPKRWRHWRAGRLHRHDG